MKNKQISAQLMRSSGYIAFLIIMVFFTIKAPAFLSYGNLVNIMAQSSVLGICGYGLTGIFIGGGDDVIRGGTDLSITLNMAVAGSVIAVMVNRGQSLGIAFLTAAAASVVIEAVNAFTVVKLKMIPLLSTICMMYVLQGVERILTNNVVVAASHPRLFFIADTAVLGVPVMAWIFIGVTIVMYLIFNVCSYGNRVSAVGGSELAAKANGINVPFIVTTTYLIAGLMAAISAVLMVARLSSYTPGAGDLQLFDVMLVSYLGAVFSRRYRPNIPGTFIASLFVGVLTNGFTLINVPSYWVYAIKGALILVTVSITTIQKRRAV
ncbi:MAG: ABC transporter permease [Dorea sp.]|nr:ABC transporter permease [Dorea sp.]MCI9614567.1 ABC transporter permease [Dorea sp.]MDE6938038.1 ABC transporter permease [Lachnospiraceae bacterium]GFI51258.1 ribose import permease protein RbsC [Lachnospiraceae bacterium]